MLERAGFPTFEERGRARRFITFHGLWHTFASHWVMSGGNMFKLQRILGHKSAVTTRYSHLAPDAFAENYRGLAGDPDAGAASGKRQDSCRMSLHAA